MCAALAGLWHASLAECLDFGLAGAEHCFVAFRASRRCSVRRSRPAWARIRARVHAFLMACEVRLLTARRGTQRLKVVDRRIQRRRYVLTLRAIDAAGNRSLVRPRSFQAR